MATARPARSINSTPGVPAAMVLVVAVGLGASTRAWASAEDLFGYGAVAPARRRAQGPPDRPPGLPHPARDAGGGRRAPGGCKHRHHQQGADHAVGVLRMLGPRGGQHAAEAEARAGAVVRHHDVVRGRQVADIDTAVGQVGVLRALEGCPTVLVVAEGAENVEYFGDIRLDLPLEMMEKIGKAIMCVVASIPNRHKYA